MNGSTRASIVIGKIRIYCSTFKKGTSCVCRVIDENTVSGNNRLSGSTYSRNGTTAAISKITYKSRIYSIDIIRINCTTIGACSVIYESTIYYIGAVSIDCTTIKITCIIVYESTISYFCTISIDGTSVISITSYKDNVFQNNISSGNL